MIDTGTASIGMMVARHVCRKRNTTPSTSSAASKMVTFTSWIELFTTSVVSKGIRYSTPGGKLPFISSRRLFTPEATSSALAPVCRNTAMPTAVLPSTVGNVS